MIEPGSGYLACGMTGDGRLADTEAIVREVFEQMSERQDLAGETVLITAGGTREPIDPVRFLGNRSSGRMGYALAAAAEQRGARVILVSAPTALAPPPRCEVLPVETTEDMHAAVLYRLPEATIVIKAAAVADFRARHVAADKLHRDASLTLELEPTEDITRSVAEHKPPGSLLIAFAAEIGLDVARAREKLLRKGADVIVLNNIIEDFRQVKIESTPIPLPGDENTKMNPSTTPLTTQPLKNSSTSPSMNTTGTTSSGGQPLSIFSSTPSASSTLT